ncbi:MAG: guanylyltransferase, partial [Bacteroidota bacterium]
FNSILAGEASAKFSLLLNDHAAFDSRISQLPTQKDVIDYFRWRNEDANRNALNAHCYWELRKNGKSAKMATKEIEGLSTAAKNELLFQRGINFNELPNWQKRGIGLYWVEYEKEGINHTTGEAIMVKRKKIKIDYDLPMKDSYSDFINIIMNENK